MPTKYSANGQNQWINVTAFDIRLMINGCPTISTYTLHVHGRTIVERSSDLVLPGKLHPDLPARLGDYAVTAPGGIVIVETFVQRANSELVGTAQGRGIEAVQVNGSGIGVRSPPHLLGRSESSRLHPRVPAVVIGC